MYFTHPRRIRRRSNLGHIFRGEKSASCGPGNTVITEQYIVYNHITTEAITAFIIYYVLLQGDRGWRSGWGTALLVGWSPDRFPVVSLGIFSVAPFTDPCALRSIQPLKMRTRDFSWGKGGRCVWLTTYHPCSFYTSRKSGTLSYPEPLGPPRPVAGWPLPYFYILLQETTRHLPEKFHYQQRLN